MLMPALRPNSRKRAVSDSVFMPAPTKGWDDSQNIAASDPQKAHILDNWFPTPEYVELRRGFAEYSDTGVTDPVESLMQYHGPGGTEKLFAAAGTSIYDVTASSGSAVVTTLTNARWQHVNFTTSGGSYLWCCNGANVPRYFDGSSWASASITGVTSGDIIGVNVFKDRLYLLLDGSTKFAYLPVDSIQGAASTYELGGVMSLGGHILAMGTLTIDGGSGPDDHAVFVTSKGQAIVFQGNDPSDPNAWSMVGIYNIPPPIGRRCLEKIAGDLGIITIAGILPLSKSMVVDRAAVANIAISANINSTITASARDYSTNYGWQIITYPRNNMFVVNVPLAEAGESHQYVMNTLNGAWCRFKGQDAGCWAVFRDRLFFGGHDGKVYEADSSSTDNGEPITCDMVPGYMFFGDRGKLKQFKMLRPHIISDGRVGSAIKVLADWGSHLRATPPTNFVGQTILSTSLWDDGREWDDGSLWPEDRIVSAQWRAVSGISRAATLWMRVQVESDQPTPVTMQVSGFDWLFEKGTML